MSPAQPVTIRRTLSHWFGFLRVAVLVVGIFGAAWHEDGYNHVLRVAVLSFAFFSVLALFALGFRCPRCRRTLVFDANKILLGGKKFSCPLCGLDIDRPPPT